MTTTKPAEARQPLEVASSVPERRMHAIRWFLTTGWLLIVGSLLYDPWTPQLTQRDHPWSLFRLPETCVSVQGTCVVEQPYPLGTTLFWGAVVPAAIFILLVFGHELWRRICPLSFLSQIPRALGLQRQLRSLQAKTGQVRTQIAKVPPDSWLAKHYGKIQFGWLFIGLCGRILFFNADRVLLASWLLLTIAAAVLVGWLYGGKAWCQYFCPMAPVQSIYSTPSGLLGSKAHLSPQPITQSMCRSTRPDGTEQSACVACQQPCIDIDAERMYWARLETRQFSFERYAYVGLVVGYFVYYYLYAGNWDYYFSGLWARQSDQLSTLLSPGFYVFGRAINIPRLVAVPITLGLFTWGGWRVGRWLEHRWRHHAHRQGLEQARTLVRHRVFVLATVLVFNVFFLFGGRPILLLLPGWVQYLFDLAIVATSTLWLVKAWRRSPDLYSREGLSSRFRKQLDKLGLDLSHYLEGRSVGDLNTHEVYVLAKVLPGFSRQKRHEAYKGVVREALEEGYVDAASSLEVLQQMRRELGISDDEHQQLLEELGVGDPALLDPAERRSLENQIRLSGYRRSLERLMALQTNDAVARRALQREFAISPQEEAMVLGGLSPSTSAAQKAQVLLQRLPGLIDAYRCLHQPNLQESPVVLALLSDHLRQRQELALRTILDCLVTLQADPAVPPLVAALQQASPLILQELLAEGDWAAQLPPDVRRQLSEPGALPAVCSIAVPLSRSVGHLESLVRDGNAIVVASSLFLITRLDRERGLALAAEIAATGGADLTVNTAQWLLANPDQTPELSGNPDLEKRVFLATSDFFRRTWVDSLEALAGQAEIRSYHRDEVITAAGDTCRELLLLIEGAATIHRQGPDGVWVEELRPGQVLDELEVLSHGTVDSPIVADAERTRLLALPVDAFDAVLDRDPDLARRVMELESRQLQRLLQLGLRRS
ncbi:cyclic nucleotide-binding domain-containing protein [Vulcanococcus limneticus]|uniref:cyclic nucleotide-binding domain-containing protein n=1 Tax=Vulcanococcus limneticus TaxID=2170428 RepID=UPI00398C1EA5